MANKNPEPVAAPAWVLTFADLMSLLLAFFVLLFSFSEMDKAKYKEVAGSMRDAFGVQQEIRANESPKGVNVIAREFSPGIPQPTPRNEVRQFTTKDSLPYPVLFDTKQISPQLVAAAKERKLADKAKLERALRYEIDEGLVELEMTDQLIILRIKEKGVFPSGSDRLEPAFEPIIRRLGDTLVETSGKIVVAGHTDDVPIENSLFRSNWHLAAGRALRVAQVFLDRSEALAPRLHLEAYAEYRPVDTNETPQGRARNRRVEVSLVYLPDEVARGLGPNANGGAQPTPEDGSLGDPPVSGASPDPSPKDAVGPTHAAPLR